MQKKIYEIDDGINFGKWPDEISKFLYFDSTKEILSKIDIPKLIADYGGANGNLKTFIPNSISIDIDKSKKPDILDNILTHEGKYDLIIIRYVLHYLNDYEIISLFNQINKFHKGKVLIIQFCNDDLISKYKNSQNEFKYFRTYSQLKSLIPYAREIYSKKYIVSPNFYLNRLKIKNAIKHTEILKAFIYDN